MIQDFLLRPKFDMMEIVKALGIVLVPAQEDVLKNIMEHSQSMVVTHPGWGNTSMIALTAFLYAWMFPGRRVGCFAPSWSQSSIIYDYIKEIVDKNDWVKPSIKECYKDSSSWTIRFHEGEDLNPSRIDSFPLGNNSRLKGYRCHTVILDEACHIPRDIFNFNIRPMMATDCDPIKTVLYHQERDFLASITFLSTKMKMLALEDLDTNYLKHRPKNQIILFTGAHHKGNYMYKIFCDWTENPEAFVVTCPFQETPPGFIDHSVIQKAKQEMPAHMFKALFEGEWVD
jgi:hypothetical protein